MLPGKWEPGFNTDEAINLSAVCTNINGQVPDAPQPAMPEDWKKIATISEGIYDNEAWLLENQQRHPSLPPQYCLAFRGTMDNVMSIVEDADIEMVTAGGYSNRAESMIHQGFKKGLESILPEIQIFLEPILLAAKTAKEQALFYVTGHS